MKTSNSKNKFGIADLIYKSVTEQLRPEEREALDLWLQKSENRLLYRELLSKEKFQRSMSVYESVNLDRMYTLFQKRLMKRGRVKKRAVRSMIYKYAAVFAIGLLATGYYLWNRGSEVFKGEESGVEIVNTIQPGYEKATLVLADGSEINLEKSKDSFVMTNAVVEVENKDNLLVYKNKEGKQNQEIRTPEYNTLHVPVGGIYSVVLPDGSTVYLNSASSLKFPEYFAGGERVVELEGEGYFDIVKNPSKPFTVKTRVRNIKVLGTRFNVSAYTEDELFSTTLVEGKVILGDEVVLSPGEQAVIPKSTGVAMVQKVETELYTVWKDGKFYFDQEPLDKILTKAGRWYGFECTFADPDLKDRLFTGVAKKTYSLSQLLDMIARTSKINYQIKYHKNENAYEVLITTN
ncbi:FecR family protein [Sinomicrobium oceani]|uniref:FecR family protein n=1 Tax=Sinomicrobium oceani TaxID=1150368 RepID=A0A1K1PWI3_9FLAO|nr:FecR domain-containing protein [Sinomicrobium oceani]SFW51849.1 FecR family protein [Sinomicrobium oceani]